ncbi:hypothetical protein GCM10010990_30510 [Croceicoccus mobilis]|uniref:Uncharacterized protein n=1 Tax=Croceicoccus mobilis TaxID=1703339 RepID=A0A916Z6D0_9SPHN|nr:hypothetical protein GCM10010990_30510 [Croceicoccus mobilis]
MNALNRARKALVSALAPYAGIGIAPISRIDQWRTDGDPAALIPRSRMGPLAVPLPLSGGAHPANFSLPFPDSICGLEAGPQMPRLCPARTTRGLGDRSRYARFPLCGSYDAHAGGMHHG